MASMEPLAESILDFWFGKLDDDGLAAESKKSCWFKKDASFDASIKRRFESYLETALMGAYDRWTSSAGGTTALIIMLDQFPRNIYRGSGKSFHWDKKALAISTKAIDDGLISELPASWAYFVLMPTMHSEDLAMQDLCVKMMESLGASHKEGAKKMFEVALDYAIQHRDIIARFGRFPHRNELLARESTKEELSFLATKGSSF